MSAIKSKQESRTVLNFNLNLPAKDQIKKILDDIEVADLYYSKDVGDVTFIDNNIIVGMYKIQLLFYSPNTNNKQKLKHRNKFKISLFEINSFGDKRINLGKDSRFNLCSWIKLNEKYQLCTEELSEIICICHRLNILKIFL